MTVNPVARGFVVIHGDLRQRLPDLPGLSPKSRFSNFRLFAPTLKGEKAEIAKTPLRVGANFSSFCLFYLAFLFRRRPFPAEKTQICLILTL